MAHMQQLVELHGGRFGSDFSHPVVQSLCSNDGTFFVHKIMAYCWNVG